MLPSPTLPERAYRPPQGDLRVVHADDWLVVLDKPPGLLSAPGRGEDKQDCLVSRGAAAFPGLLLVHRLDMDTSGLMVMARDAVTHAALSALFRDRAVDKRYVARVHGRPGAEQGSVDLPLIVDWPNRPRQKICHDTGKPSLTHWRRLGDAVPAGQCLLALEPVTGRSHQLRVHLAAIGHPIVGDPFYGLAADGAPRMMLHAARLTFRHPLTQQLLDLTSPADFG